MHVRARLDARGLTNVGYVSNPEFLAEGSAVADFTTPDRIVVGAFDDAGDADRVVELHRGIGGEIVRTDVHSAELVKLAANAFLSTRISFINEIANVCELVDADVVDVARGIGLDHRLGPHFLRAGIGFGGSCLIGDETVLARSDGETRLVSLERSSTRRSSRASSWKCCRGTAAATGRSSCRSTSSHVASTPARFSRSGRRWAGVSA